MKRLVLAVAMIAALLAIPQAAIDGGARAAAATCANEIACENELPGAPQSEWDINGAGDPDIQGFATQISVNRGERIDFKVQALSAYSISIYRTGYYQGLGARLIDTIPGVIQPQTQPSCIDDVSTGLVDCGNWAVSASWNVPATAVSGVYIAVLRRVSGGASHITFIVRDDASHSDLVFQTSDTTWQAYNSYTADFYVGGTHGSPARAFKISYNRPVVTRSPGVVPWGRDFYMANEFPLVRFLERNGYDVSYIAGPDTDRRGHLLTNHKTFLSVGHDEYWSGRQRANVEAARDAGVNLMFLSGNEMYWRVRWENSIDGSQTSYRTLTSYKETWERGKVDPSPEWTGTFRDPRYASQANGAGIPENAVTGTLFKANRVEGTPAITVDAREGRLRLWRNTDLASLPDGQSRALTPSTVGYESDEDVDNGFRPPGLIRLSTTTAQTQEYVSGFGNIEDVAPGPTTTHHVTMYRAASGALVFSAGTVQWTWGLDSFHDAPGTPPPADPRMQQAQVNLLADMGAQPTTLMAGLQAAAPSTDTTGPTTTITSPGGAQPNGARVTVAGSASDVGGGQVAGVEVSTDRGVTWHPATGTTSWSYTYTQHGYGSTPVRVRAVDDSANIGPTRTRQSQVSCPCSIFGNEVPANPMVDDASATEVGLRFVPTRNGQVTGVRFFKGSANTGTHVGRLWGAGGGPPLAQATFGAESATGWQEVSFGSPVTVQAGQTYVVSYTAPNGRYPILRDAFELVGVAADPLSVPGGFAGGESGVFSSTPGTFPDQSFRNSNYYVDVLFQASGAPDPVPTLAVTGQQPAPGATGVPTTATVAVDFSAPIESGATLSLGQGSTGIAGTVVASADRRTLTFTPSAPLPAQAEITASLADVTSTDGIDLAPTSWSFTTAATPPDTSPNTPPTTPPTTPPPGTDPPGSSTKTATLFDDVAPKGAPTTRRGIEVGVEFTVAQAGSVVALRYYQVRGEAAPRSVTLWSAQGKALAREKISTRREKPKKAGWRVVVLDDSVSLSPGKKYVASYFLPHGRAARTPGFYKSKVWKSGPLRAKRSDNGRYVNAPRSRFPTKRAAGVNFFADVRFEY